MAKSLTHKHLLMYLRYEPDTGRFERLKKSSCKDIPGTCAGSLANDGGIDIRLFGALYRAHRLAWFYMTREWPRWTIDHINGVRTDNRWINLRDIPQGMNIQNIRKAPISNRSSGLLGATRGGRGWRARIKVQGTVHHLGVFDTAEKAHEAYLTAKRRLHAGCTI